MSEEALRRAPSPARPRRRRAQVSTCLTLCLVGACAAPRAASEAPPAASQHNLPAAAPAVTSATTPAAATMGLVTSNILRRDYAGSRACEPCHGDIYDRFQSAPMHRMTRLPRDGEVRAPFTGRFAFKDDAVEFAHVDGDRYMRIASGQFGTRLFRVTRVIGGHYREDFAGVEVDAIGRAAHVLGNGRDERILPASYFFAAGAWRYKGYSVLGPERPGLRPGGVWNRTCLFCHNTIPYLSDLLGTLASPAAGAYQGERVDALLPRERRWRLEVTDEAALAAALTEEITRLTGAPPRTSGAALRDEAVRVTRARFGAAELLELGIGCESCHGGSAEHVRHSQVHPSLGVRSPFVREVPPSGAATATTSQATAATFAVAPSSAATAPPSASSHAAVAPSSAATTPPSTSSHTAAAPSSAATTPRDAGHAQETTRVCARCHQVLFSGYPWSWEGKTRREPAPGGGNINSGEARDLLLGHCASAMTCTACHDPHAHNRPRMADVEARADAICLGCHTALAGAAAQRAHTHHDPAGAGGRCLACHMPRKNLSLDNRLSRYHRLAAPNERAKVEGDRPLECGLCHADRSVAALVTTMERWWPVRYDRAALRRLYGDDLEHADPLLATLARGKPHEQAVAIALLGERRTRAAVPLIAAQLTHPVPIVRYYAAAALGAILGEPAPVDVHADNRAIAAAARGWLARFGLAAAAPLPPRGPAASDDGDGDP